MFTGIITDLGRIRAIQAGGDTRFTLGTSYDTNEIEIGASIACSGPCLTVIDKGPGWFDVAASSETMSHTTLGEWRESTPVNLERPVTPATELGGHIVSGHVDGTARILELSYEGDSVRLVFEVPQPLARFIAPKGSIALDGVSLTVNEVEDRPGGGARFGVNIIAHTRARTTFGEVVAGAMVNVEVDMVARYLARLLDRT